MKLDPKIVEASAIDAFDKLAEARARRVLKAASGCVPDGVVEAACMAAGLSGVNLLGLSWSNRVRAALSAGLAKWAEEE